MTCSGNVTRCCVDLWPVLLEYRNMRFAPKPVTKGKLGTVASPISNSLRFAPVPYRKPSLMANASAWSLHESFRREAIALDLAALQLRDSVIVDPVRIATANEQKGWTE